ncbi:MAG: 2,3-bisphosphoglycerate-independent phosphoglycerate mutase [Pseudomonadota bacterium]
MTEPSQPRSDRLRPPVPRPVVLCILDGWGHRPDPAQPDNAIWQAKTPNLDRLAAGSPMSFLDASELAVGLPMGQMGNSEVGHMNLGGGRVVLQDLPRIDQAIKDGTLAKNPALLEFAAKLEASGGACHLMGLVSPGGVHSHQAHIAALANIVASQGVAVRIHAFLDGRDTPPSSARDHLARFEAALSPGAGIATATVSGRFYAMDRDKRWERVEKAYDALVLARGERAPTADAAVAQSYAREVTDEFVAPTVIDGYGGMKDGDGVLMGNFRADRAREILTALLDPAFSGFARARRVRFAAAAGLVEYSAALNAFLTTLFPPETVRNSIGEIVSKAGLKQLRIAETEKYAHVTFFFNGGEETVFPGEDRILVPSPKVATYDLKPEMSAYEVTDKLVEAIDAQTYDFIVVNYANTDMVGHTGNLAAAIEAVEAVDRCLGRVAEAVTRVGGAMLITADHGNAEMMFDPETGQPHTAHTLNRVPAMLVNAPAGFDALADGRLADVAPTLLALMGLPQPAEMTGRSLIRPGAKRVERERRVGE